MTKKHAYLIIAHDNFEVLTQLIVLLDDVRNDIYLHIDQKVSKIPSFSTKFSKLNVLKTRMDVRWGTISQIDCEYLLFGEALQAEEVYSRFHLISGTHLPLKSNEYIYDFFERRPNLEILNKLETSFEEINFKLGYRHFFVRCFNSRNRFIDRSARFLWLASLRFQKIFHIKFPNLIGVDKANNWVSLTREAVYHLLNNEKYIKKRFKRSFCGDEFFVPFLFKDNEKFTLHHNPLLLYNDFNMVSPRELTMEDYNFLIHSDYLFARKFSDNHLDIVSQITNHLKSLGHGK